MSNVQNRLKRNDENDEGDADNLHQNLEDIEIAQAALKAVDEDEEFPSEVKIVLTQEMIAEAVAEDLPLKEMTYKQHEFVKLTHVGNLLNEAMQFVFEKVTQTNKITAANKTMLRNMDAKLKNMETTVVQVGKLTKQVNDHHTKLKELKLEFDNFSQFRVGDLQSQEYQNMKLATNISNMETIAKVQAETIQNLFDKGSKLDEALEDMSAHVQKLVDQSSCDLQQQVIEQNQKVMLLELRCDQITKHFESTIADIQGKKNKEFNQLVQSLSADSQRLVDLELKVKRTEYFDSRLEIINHSVNQVLKNIDDTRELQLFVERIVPLMTQLQISEGLQVLLTTKAQKVALLEYDKSKLYELTQYIGRSRQSTPKVGALAMRIEAFGKLLVDKENGSAPFGFGAGRQYWPNMSFPFQISAADMNVDSIIEIQELRYSLARETHEQLIEEQTQKMIDQYQAAVDQKIQDLSARRSGSKIQQQPTKEESAKTTTQTPSQIQASISVSKAQKMSLGASVIKQRLSQALADAKKQTEAKVLQSTIFNEEKPESEETQQKVIETENKSPISLAIPEPKISETIQATQFLSETSRHLSDHEVPKLLQPTQSLQLTQYRYVNVTDKRRIRRIELRQREFRRVFQDQYIETVQNVEEKFEENEQNFEKVSDQVTSLQNVISLIKAFVSASTQDKEKFKDQLVQLERRTQEAIKQKLITVEKDKVAEDQLQLKKAQTVVQQNHDQRLRGLQSIDSKDTKKLEQIIQQTKFQSLTNQTEVQKVAEPKSKLLKQSSASKAIMEEQQAAMKLMKQEQQEFSNKMQAFMGQIAKTEIKINDQVLKLEKEIQIQLTSERQRQTTAAQDLVLQLKKEADITKVQVLDRQQSLEDQFKFLDLKVTKYMEMTDDLFTMFKRDYDEFLRDRRRWKSDFDAATTNAKNNVQEVQELIKDCLNQNKTNTKALKMILDVQMIAQLCEKQDVVDKKQIGVFGMKQNQDIINLDSTEDQDSKILANQTLKVDRNCLQCSGNMNQTLHQLKLACLSYTSSPIQYQDKQYQLQDLLKVKASVINECQRLIRDHFYQSDKYDGEGITKYNDERGFVIEPLVNGMLKRVQSPISVQEQSKTFVVIPPQVFSTQQEFVDVRLKQPLTERRASFAGRLKGLADSENRSGRPTGPSSDVFDSSIGMVQTYQNSISVVQDSVEFKRNQVNQTQYDPFSPLSVKGSQAIGEDQKKKLKLWQKTGQIIDSQSFPQNELSQFSPRATLKSNRPGTQGYSLQGGIESRRGVSTVNQIGINRDKPNLDRKVYLQPLKLSVDGQQISFNN